MTNILQEAEKMVYGDREEDYGSPLENYEMIATLWTGTLKKVLKPGAEVTPELAALCMVCVKVAREAGRHKYDNIVDGAGYFALLERIVKERHARDVMENRT